MAVKIKALVFDFDGLILDTEAPAFHSWQEIYAERLCELTFAAWSACIGTSNDLFDPVAHLETLSGQPVDREAIKTLQRQREHEIILLQPVMPGIVDYLQIAKRLNLKLGLASSSSWRWVTSHLSRLGLLPYFDTIQTADNVKRVKPDPALYRQAIEALDVLPSQAVALDDSPNGILAAKAAGLFCVAVPNEVTRQMVFEHVDYELASLTELSLEQLLAQIESLR